MHRQKYQVHFFSSLFLHIIVLIVLIISFEFGGKPFVVRNSDKPDEFINAMMMDEPPEPTKIVQKSAQTPVPPRPVAPPGPKPPTPPKSQEERIKTPAIAIPDQSKKLQEEIIQKQLLAELKKQTEQKKKQKQKALQAELEKEMNQLKAAALQQQMLQEQKRLAKARSQQMQGVVDKYKALILQSIAQHWRIPPNVNKKRYAELMIRLAPGGTVLDVQLIKTSGDEGLDRSARAAIFKASPLPVPTEPEAFEAFRQFVLKVKPENVLTEA